MGDMGSTFNGLSGKTKDDFGHGEAKFITYMNVFSNPIADLTMTESIEIDKKQKSVKAGDVFFTTSSETPDEVGMSSVMPEDADNIYLNSFCFGYRPTEKFDLNYLAYVLRADSFRKEMTFLAQGISRYNISKNKVMEVCIPVPTIEEQTKVGRYFRNLDHLITLHQRKLDHVKDLKKSMLQKMFPKNGQLYPEVRFPEFTDAWEQRKLGDVLVLLKDGTHGTHKDSESGPLLLSAKNIKNGTIQWDESDRRISEDEYNNIHSNFKLQKGDVLLTIVGSIGETAILSQSKGVTFQRSVAFLRPSDKISSEFLYSEIQGQKFQKALNVRKSTSAQPGIYLGDLGTIPIEFPTSDEEQMQIGSYFQNLDNLITLHQRELDHLKLLKKGMLQQMFV